MPGTPFLLNQLYRNPPRFCLDLLPLAAGGRHFTASTNRAGPAVRLAKSSHQNKRKQTRSHERSPPDQVEVEPSLPENREAEPTIERPRDQPRDGKITDRVDSCGEHRC